jgi:putative membrane protein
VSQPSNEPATPSRSLARLLLVIMVVAALAHLAFHVLPVLNKQELDFIVIPLTGAVFAFASAAYVLGMRGAVTFLGVATVIGWVAEEVGVRTGAVFGSYVYSAALGPKLGSVPYVIPVFWFMIVYVAYAISNLIAEGALDWSGKLVPTLGVSVLGAFVATAYDLGLDPYMSSPTIAAWTWLDGGPYFGVPLQNYLGWIGTACLILLVFRALHRWLGGSAPVGSLTRFIACLPIVVYVSFWISLLGKSHPAPTRMICLIALGMPSLAAIAVWHRWRVANEAG